MAIVHIEYDVTVTAVVDTKVNEVIAVVVDDTDLRLREKYRHSIYRADPDEAGDDDDVQAAVDIAEDKTWPAWVVGW